MLKNSLSNLLISISSPLMTILTVPLATKALGVNSFGQAAVHLSIISYVGVVSSLGLSVYGTRELSRLAKNPEDYSKTFAELLTLNVLSSFACSLTYLLFCLSVIEVNREVILLGTMSILFSFLNIEWLLYSKENYKAFAIATLFGKGIGLVLLIFFVNSPDDLNIYLAVTLFSNALPAVLTFSSCRAHITLSLCNMDLKRHLISISTFLSIRICSSVSAILDTVIVGMFVGVSIAGMHNLASRVARIIVTMSCALTAVALPRASELYQNEDKSAYYCLLSDSLVVSIVLACLASTAILILSDDIILLLSGPDFLPASAALSILSLLAPLVGLSNFIGMQILYPARKERAVSVSLICGALVFILMAPMLIFWQELIGGSLAVILSEATILCVQAVFARTHLIALYAQCKERLIRLGWLSAVTLILVVSLSQLIHSTLFVLNATLTFTIILAYLIALIFIKEPLIQRFLAKFRR